MKMRYELEVHADTCNSSNVSNKPSLQIETDTSDQRYLTLNLSMPERTIKISKAEMKRLIEIEADERSST